jgi:hypothetical protein
MGRPPMSEEDKKSEAITIHCTKRQYDKIVDKAGDYSASEFCLNAALGKEILPKDPTLPKLLFELSKIGGNINQIAYRLNSGDINSLDQTDESVLSVVQKLLEDVKIEMSK